MLFVFHSQTECRLTIYLFLAFALLCGGQHPITGTQPLPGPEHGSVLGLGPCPDTWPASVTSFRYQNRQRAAASIAGAV